MFPVHCFCRCDDNLGAIAYLWAMLWTMKLVIFQCTGAACEHPIFYEGEKCHVSKRFHFSSYGKLPPNYKEFDDLRNFGLCGSAGDSDDVHKVAKAIELLNKEDRVGLCEGFVINELRIAGYEVEQVDKGFR